jgi:hypothetical protein
MTIKELSILYALKEKHKLIKILSSIEVSKYILDKWFTDFNLTYSNSILNKSSYYSDIRKPYNDKYEEYISVMDNYRACTYYINRLS